MATIRPIRLPRDIPGLINVTLHSFQYPDHPEWSLQDDEAQAIVAQLRSLRYLWPLLALAQGIVPAMRDLFRGFIAEEDGAPVGCVFLMRQGGGQRREIANVAVLPAYRRRGIARQLVETAIVFAQKRGATSLALDVIADNLPAVTLYTSLGFTRVMDSLTYSHPQVSPMSAPPLPAGYSLADTSIAEWRARFELVKRITPPEVAALNPVKEDDQRVTSGERVAMSVFAPLSGNRQRQLLVRSQDGAVVATAPYNARTRPGGITNCWPMLDPAHADLAPLLVQTLRQTLRQQSPGRRLELVVPDWQEALVAEAQAEGFTLLIRSSKMLKTL
ncbi:MAG: GNAT family N-acetyltransferase [Ktedonobacterales bacterium]